MIENSPLIVVITPVRNEAWILNAFLSATSIWADKIIIADQMSTDGSRNIYNRYPKVSVIDNTMKEMNQSAARRMLFEEAKKIKKDMILFALDADEFLSGDFMHSNDWNKIIKSNKNDCFLWSWMNICAHNINEYTTHEPYFWAVHVSDDLWNGAYPEYAIHEHRLPWPPQADDSHVIRITDFYSIHFGGVNVTRDRNKSRFYQVSSIGDIRYNMVNLYHQYHSEKKIDAHYSVPSDAYKTYLDSGLNIFSLIDFTDDGQYYTNEILDQMSKNGVKKYAWLDIWDKEWCTKNGISCPQQWYHKLFLWYMRFSNAHRNILTRSIDYMLKLILF